MNVNSVTNTTPIGSDLSSLAPVDPGMMPDAAQTSLSQDGQLFGELASLAKSDPEKFKKVAATISAKLSDEASKTEGDRGKFLKGLADKFGQAAQTGDASGLAPGVAAGQHGHGHHHRHAHAASSSSGANAIQPLSKVVAQALQDITGTSTP